MSGNNFAPDYVDVATRVAEFREKYPDGSLQPADLTSPFQIVTLGGDTYIAVVAAAYRGPEDPRPGVGMAYEVYPGKTPYTKGSELQNAETSAWGRAIMAALAADSRRGIASADEVRNRQAEREEPTPDLRQEWWDRIINLGATGGHTAGSIRKHYAEKQGHEIDGPESTPATLEAYHDKLAAHFDEQRAAKPDTPAEDPWQTPAPVGAE